MAQVKPTTKAARKAPSKAPKAAAAKAATKAAEEKVSTPSEEVEEVAVEQEEKKAPVKPTTTPSVEAEPVRDVTPDELEEGYAIVESTTFTVRADNKKYENRTPEQVAALVVGLLGSVSKITIE